MRAVGGACERFDRVLLNGDRTTRLPHCQCPGTGAAADACGQRNRTVAAFELQVYKKRLAMTLANRRTLDDRTPARYASPKMLPLT